MPKRLVPALAAVLALLALVVSGWRASERDRPVAVRGSAPFVASTLYLLTADRTAPLGVRRPVPRRSPYARQALRALLAGPTRPERSQGFTSAIPAGTTLLTFRTEGRTTAIVNLSGLPSKASGVDRVRVITQITRTLVGLSGITHVRLRNEGKPWGLWRMSRGIADSAYGYAELLGFTRVCAAKPGTETVEGDCFSALP